MSPRDRSPVRTSSPRQPSGKDQWNQWSHYNLTLLQLEQTTDSSGQRGTGPPIEPGFSQSFFSVLSLTKFWFVAVVTSGLLSWGHFISSNITDLIAEILFEHELDDAITEFNNEVLLTQKCFYFDIVQLL